MCLSHDNLMNMFMTNFALMQNFQYSLTELENMMPWEREIYIHLLVEHLKEEKQRAEDMKRESGGGAR